MPRVLVVDDEPDLVAYVEDMLESIGLESGRAGDGVEGVLKVLDGGWDVVLMDIRMPRLDGVNALRIIRRVAPALPVVMLTGQAGQGDMAESARLGAVACLLKPVSNQELAKTMELALLKAHSGRDARSTRAV